MFFQNKEIVIDNTDYRLHDLTNALTFILASIVTAHHLRSLGEANYPPGLTTFVEAKAFGKNIHFPVSGVIEASVQNKKLDKIPLSIQDINPSPITDSVLISSILQATHLIFRIHFISYYEKYVDLAEEKFTDKHFTWPACWRLGRAIRDGLVHDNKIYITNPKTPDIEFGGIKISFANNNEEVLGNYIHYGDLFLLILEMDAQLEL